MAERKASGKNLIDLRKSNKKRILKLLCANGPLCGSDIARRINLSIGGTANITDEMLSDVSFYAIVQGLFHDEYILEHDLSLSTLRVIAYMGVLPR